MLHALLLSPVNLVFILIIGRSSHSTNRELAPVVGALKAFQNKFTNQISLFPSKDNPGRWVLQKQELLSENEVKELKLEINYDGEQGYRFA